MNKRLESIIARGTYPGESVRIPRKDQGDASVIAHKYAYCSPRPGWFDEAPDDYSGPFTHVEVGLWSTPQPWEQWSEYAEDEQPRDGALRVFAYVPVGLVRELVADSAETKLKEVTE